MAPDITHVQVTCPRCTTSYIIDFPVNEHEAVKEKGIVTVAILPPCGHASQVFIDAKGKCRGGQTADIVLDAGAIHATGKGETRATNGAMKEERVDLISKLASDVIVEDAKDTHEIKALGADEKVDIAELALISGYPDAARIIFEDLKTFCMGIDDYDFAENLERRIEMIDHFVHKTQDISEVLAEIERDGAESRGDLQVRLEKQRARLDEIIVDLRFANIKGDISNSEFEYKRARWMALKARLT